MKLTNISVIKELMAKHGVSFTKSLGQNFLTSPSVCPKMCSGLSSSSTVIEIGAGIGVLTRELSQRVKKVIVIEIDETLKPILEETLEGCDNVEIIWGDVLKINLFEILAKRDIETADVCANLPYYAATHIIMQLLEQHLPLNTITAMVQREVAQRFVAKPCSKQYGIVSVAARYYSEPKTLFNVSRGNFIPIPNVDSTVIRLDISSFENSENNEYKNPEFEKRFFKLVRTAFSERRKQLITPVSKEYDIDKEAIKSALESIGRKPNSRAEELSIGDFIKLYKKMEGIKP